MNDIPILALVFRVLCESGAVSSVTQPSRGVQAARLEEKFSEFNKWLECLK